MKKRKLDMRENPLQEKKIKKSSTYIGDAKLGDRVRLYLEENKARATVSLSLIADDLQAKYGEYSRKKKTAFRKSVEKVYNVLVKQNKRKDPAAQGSAQAGGGDSESEDSYSSENSEYKVYEDSNNMNSFMQNLYKKTPTGSRNTSGQSGSNTPVKPSSPASHKTPIGSLSLLSSKMDSNDQVSETVIGTAMKIDSVDNDNPEDNNKFVIDRAGTNIEPSSIPGQQVTGQLASSTPLSTATSINKSLSVSQGDDDRTSASTPADVDMSSLRSKRKINETGSKSVSKKSRRRLGRDDYDRKPRVPEPQMTTINFSQIGGCDETLMELCKLLMHMKHPEVYQQLGVTPPRGMLLHGPPGCGKTLLAHAVAGELEMPLIKLAATEVVSGVSGESEEKIRDLFDKATTSAPCVLFLDEIDAISQKRENASKDMERRIVSQLLTCMDDLNNNPSVQVMVIGATNRPDSLDPALRRAGRFDREIALGIPDEQARKRILEVICRDLKLEEGFDFLVLAHNTPGYVGADLNALAREAAMTAVNRAFLALQDKDTLIQSETSQLLDSQQSAVQVNKNNEFVPLSSNCSNNEHVVELGISSCLVPQPSISQPENVSTASKDTSAELQMVLGWLKDHASLTPQQLEDMFITWTDFQEAIKVVQPSAKREGFATVPDVTWKDIGALHDVREELQLAILAPVRHPEQFAALGLSNPPGVLLVGPPGCGKTLLAKAVANESGINFISVKGPELLNMYVGESERAVRQVFQRARNSAPCVIFFDELDALCPRRSDSGEGGSSVRVVNQLLTEMDGVEARKQVFIMGATNRPDIIDPAILRPGRLDKLLYVGLPEVQDRLDILHAITKNGTKPRLAEGTDLSAIAADERCQGYTGADLSALVREASVTALKEFMSRPVDEASQGFVVVHQEHFDQAFKKVAPSVSEKDHTLYERIKERCRRDS